MESTSLRQQEQQQQHIESEATMADGDVIESNGNAGIDQVAIGAMGGSGGVVNVRKDDFVRVIIQALRGLNYRCILSFFYIISLHIILLFIANGEES